METLKSLSAKLDSLETSVAQQQVVIAKEKIDIIRRKTLGCVHCKRKSRFGMWRFVQNFWYTPPSGCSEGDYWNRSRTELCHIACPKCGEQNYIYNHPQKNMVVDIVDNQRVVKKDIFAELYEQYGDHPLKCVENT